MERGYRQKLAPKSSPIVKLLARGNKVRLLLEPIRPRAAVKLRLSRPSPRFQGSSLDKLEPIAVEQRSL